MENLDNNESGKIYFFKPDFSSDPKNPFSPLLEVNHDFSLLNSLHINYGKAIGITSNNELLEWIYNKNQKDTSTIDTISPSPRKSQKNKSTFLYLLTKPTYTFNKLKFVSISVNKTMCLGLDPLGNVLVWGKNNDGLLGLGYYTTNVEIPTIIQELKNIKNIFLNYYHAGAVNFNGKAFSWGLGKYGELGQERAIYSSKPKMMITDSIYSKVYCGNLITCFLDEKGHFYYYGVIIKQLPGNNGSKTTKSLLDDQSYNDGKIIFIEKQIEELENENFINIIIGNGFVGLLSDEGGLYVLEYNDKLTKLYCNFFIYNISVNYNEIYGLAKNDKNYYLCKWSGKSFDDFDLYNDKWMTTVWKFFDDFQIINGCQLLNTNNNRNILLLKDTKVSSF